MPGASMLLKLLDLALGGKQWILGRYASEIRVEALLHKGCVILYIYIYVSTIYT